jgi:TM2 domain-containing membrane protein YozV
MVIIILLAIWALFIFGGAKIMQGKGRSTIAGALLGLVLGVFGVLICLCFSKTIEKKAEEAAQIRTILGDPQLQHNPGDQIGSAPASNQTP